jgi:hypothetical protein
MERVRRIVQDNYEPGNHKRSKLQVFRRRIADECLISERTFWRYIKDMDQEK